MAAGRQADSGGASARPSNARAYVPIALALAAGLGILLFERTCGRRDSAAGGAGSPSRTSEDLEPTSPAAPTPPSALPPPPGSPDAKLDRAWDTIVATLNRESPSLLRYLPDPASKAQIAAAEIAVGFDFPAELRWLLRKANGQDARDNKANFVNGSRLLSAAEIAERYREVKGIIVDHLKLHNPAEIAPSGKQDRFWWPDLLPFAVDAGGDHWYIHAGTGEVFSEFEGSVQAKNVALESLERPMVFLQWITDYASRLEAGRYDVQKEAGGILWMPEPNP